jgi:hypothetical protein
MTLVKQLIELLQEYEISVREYRTEKYSNERILEF